MPRMIISIHIRITGSEETIKRVACNLDIPFVYHLADGRWVIAYQTIQHK